MSVDSVCAPSAEPELAGAADSVAGELMALVPNAVRLAMLMGLSSDDAADAVQDAVILAWRRHGQLRGPLLPWFLSIVRRRALRTRRWLTLPAFWGSERDEWPRDAEWHAEMVAALRALPVRQRAALWLRYGLDMSTADVARTLGTTEGSAKQLLLRARAGARSRLQAEVSS
jgi:RNA polymerase sigma factor (sigma-70 family)